MATTVERPVRDLWRTEGGYQGFTRCYGCGEMANCCGASPALRICIGCFEFEFNCRFPRVRRG